MNLNPRNIIINKEIMITQGTKKNICMNNLTDWKRERLNNIRRVVFKIIKKKSNIMQIKKLKLKIAVKMASISLFQMNSLEILINLIFIINIMILFIPKIPNSLMI